MDVRLTSGTQPRGAAAGGRRATTVSPLGHGQGGLHGLAVRAAAELERLRPHTDHHPRRTRAESVLERVKHLV